MIRAWWLADQVELTPGEQVAEAWNYVWLNRWWGQSHGNLYLTNQRLIWLRWRFWPPFGPRSIVVVLDQVRGLLVQRRMFDFFYKSVTLKFADRSDQRFIGLGRNVDRLTTLLESALRQRGFMK